MLSTLERNAWHEAAHALVSTRLGIPVRQVVLRETSGTCHTDAAAAIACTRLSDLIPRAASSLLAGRVVEKLLGLDAEAAGPDEDKLLDLLRLHQRAGAATTKADMDRLLEQGYARAELICRSEWGVLRKLADWLLRVGVLEPAHLATVLETASPEVLIAPVPRLLELGKMAGDEPYLVRSRALKWLTQAACEARWQAEVEEFEKLAAEPALPASARVGSQLPASVAAGSWTRPAPIHPRRPLGPSRPASFSRPYPRGAA